jgi:prevent-host-death family protein
MEWKVADAKNRFSEVMTKALEEGPQRIRRRDGTVVMISEEELERIKGTRTGFNEFLLSIPDMEGVDVDRDRSLDRELDW